VLKDGHLSITRRATGKIVEVYPESDDMARVAIVRMADAQFRRPISKTCLPPVRATKSQDEG